jgi:hypothetical protein
LQKSIVEENPSFVKSEDYKVSDLATDCTGGCTELKDAYCPE